MKKGKRGKRGKFKIKTILKKSARGFPPYQFVNKLYKMGEVKYKNLFVDGTKIEAYANKYTFVWKSAVEKNLAKLEKKIEVLLSVLSERYGFSENISLEESYEQLCLQAQWLNLVFAVGKGKHKTQLQRDIELLRNCITLKNEDFADPLFVILFFASF